MQIAKNQNGVVIPASSLQKRVHDIEGEKYYCIHCGIEVIPRIGDYGLSHYAKHNEVLHKSGCPEIYLNTSNKLPSSNSKFINFKAAKDAILKNLNFLELSDLVFKVEMSELLVTKNNLPVYNNKQTYVILTEIIDDNLTMDNNLKLTSELDLSFLNKGQKFLLLAPVVNNEVKIKAIDNIYLYSDMEDKYQDYFENIITKTKR